MGAVLEGGEAPGECPGVAEAGVHGLAAGGCVEVGGVSGEDGPAVGEAFGEAFVDLVVGDAVDAFEVQGGAEAEGVDGFLEVLGAQFAVAVDGFGRDGSGDAYGAVRQWQQGDRAGGSDVHGGGVGVGGS
ncbi:hypothetical protein KO717_00020 [Streptomyces xanthophaeus]|nr:hypothetical protein [Streptomyces xanthophaeus]WKD30521.1 hypothetical protein KO717_00020 [Streptomyces xanthophaeus]